MKASVDGNRPVFLVLLVAFLTTVNAPVATAGGERLTLRINDAQGVPGGLVAVTLRTYESKGVGQGQACFRANAPFLGSGGEQGTVDKPFGEYIGSAVFSTAEDAVHDLRPTEGPEQSFVMDFWSPSASINETDGPLSVTYLRLRSDLEAGQRFQLTLDLGDTFLLDENGNSIPVEIVGGELTVRALGSPMNVEADAGDVRPGQVALVSFETAEPIGFLEGTVTLIYEEDIAAGDPMVVIDPKFGDAEFSVDNSVEGRTVVTFTSTNALFNRIPGNIIDFYIPTRSDVPLGTESPVRFDRNETVLFDKDGQEIDVRFEADEIEFEND